MKQVVERAGELPILGETSHLYKREYRGEVLDCGDTTEAMSGSGYYGEALRQTYQRYVNELNAHPPRFIVSNWQSLVAYTNI